MGDDEGIVRTALLWLLAVSVLASPQTFSAAPVLVPASLVVLHEVILAALFLLLLTRVLSSAAATAAATAVGSAAALGVWTATLRATSAGPVTEDLLGNMLLQACVAIGGIAFMGLRTRTALAASLSLVTAHVAVLLAVGRGGFDVLVSRGVIQSVRFALIAIVLFLVVRLIAERRGRERDRAFRAARRHRQEARRLADADLLRRQAEAETTHELRSPLTILRGAVETLARAQEHGGLGADEHARLLAAMQRSIDRLAIRVDEVMEVAHDGRVPADSRTVVHDLGASLRAIAADDADLCAGRRLVVTAPFGRMAELPEDALEHVVENLLANAAKYGPPGTDIAIEASIDGDVATVRVRDEGTSLDGMDTDRLFDPWVRATATANDAPGSGMGLAVVRRLVRSWGGDVWCRTGDAGTTFAFTVPLLPHTTAPAPSGERATAPRRTHER